MDSEGCVALSWTGSHFKGRAGTVLSFGGVDYEFPIPGSKYNAKTVMSAVEIGGSGHPLVRFRLTCGRYRAALHDDPRVVEVVVNPDALSIPQMALVIAVASPWLRTYFSSPGAS